MRSGEHTRYYLTRWQSSVPHTWGCTHAHAVLQFLHIILLQYWDFYQIISPWYLLHLSEKLIWYLILISDHNTSVWFILIPTTLQRRLSGVQRRTTTTIPCVIRFDGMNAFYLVCEFQVAEIVAKTGVRSGSGTSDCTKLFTPTRTVLPVRFYICQLRT